MSVFMVERVGVYLEGEMESLGYYICFGYDQYGGNPNQVQDLGSWNLKEDGLAKYDISRDNDLFCVKVKSSVPFMILRVTKEYA